ncbi:KLHL9 protein, partial [Atractosteus spatula]|nr:KLHL9 protein [Atractosteus spatula]
MVSRELKGTEGKLLTSDAHSLRILEGARSLREQGALCDVTLEAEDVRFPVHRVILASASSYCRVLFTATDDVPSVVPLRDVSARGLGRVLDFVYTGRLELGLATLEETLKAAEALLVRDAVKLCFGFLDEALGPDTCLEILGIARRHGPEELRQKAARYVGARHQALLRDREELVRLDEEVLRGILERSDLGGYSEAELLRCVMQWLQHSPARAQHSLDLLRRIRFPLIPAGDLQELLQESPLLKTDSHCFRLLQEALAYHAQPYAQPALQGPSTQVRCGSDGLVVVGGRTADNKVCKEVWVSDERCATWRRLGELCSPLYNHCSAVLGGFLFVLGGQHKFDPAGNQPTNEVFRYDPRDGTWLQVAGMLEKRTRFHADVLAGHLVAVAGGTLRGRLTASAEQYRPAENRWEPTAPLPVAVADHAGATLQGILYVAGSGFSGGKTLRDLYSYLPRLQHWVPNRPMAFPRCDHAMAAAGDRIFCVGGRALNPAQEWVHVNEMECYSPAADQWTAVKVSAMERCQFSLSARGSRLCVAGGGSLRSLSKTGDVSLYDCEGRRWERAGALPVPLVDHTASLLTLPGGVLAGLAPEERPSPPPAARKSTLNLFVME